MATITLSGIASNGTVGLQEVGLSIALAGIGSGEVFGSAIVVPGYLEIGSGGVVASGSASVYDPINVYPNTSPWPTPIVVNGSANLVAAYKYKPTGGVVVSGSLTARSTYVFESSGKSANPPQYGGVIVGYESDRDPSIVNLVFDLDYSFVWASDSYIQIDTEFLWNTGKLNQYWYRIVGKGKTNGCPPVNIHDTCCQKYILNVHARSVDDLCAKLKQRNWRWPIESVQRFTTPAENSVLAADLGNNITHDCNDTVPVDVCVNSLCAEFCIDYDMVETWGGYAISHYNATFEAQTSGGLVVSGIAKTTFAKILYFASHVATGGVVLSGQANTLSSGYAYTSTGGPVVGGAAVTQSSHFDYVGGVWPYDTLPQNPTVFAQFEEGQRDQLWQLPERVLLADNQFSSSDVSYLGYSSFLVVSGFGFQLPAGVSVRGIRALVNRKAVSSLADAEVYLLLGMNIVSDNLASPNYWPVGIAAVATYGGTEDQWRSQSNLGNWGVDDINNPGFGVAIRVQGKNDAPGVIAMIDNIQLEVYYEVIPGQTVRISGSAGVVSTSWNYASSGGMVLSGAIKVRSAYRVLGTGVGSVGPNYSSVVVSGEYTPNWHYVVMGAVEVSGSGLFVPSHYDYVSSGTVVVGGESHQTSSHYHYSSSGPLVLAGDPGLSNSFHYNSTGGAVVGSPDNNISADLRFGMSGDVVVSGDAGVVSSDFHWFSEGGVAVSGSADLVYGGQGTIEADFGMVVLAEDLLMVYGADSLLPPPLPQSKTTITECGCENLPLTMPFSHNIIKNNKLSQFVSRNNLKVPNKLNLLYNKTNDCWQANQHYVGFSPNTTTKESWNLVFELACTSLVGGEPIGRNVWKLAVLVLLRDLTTLESLDTRIVVGFLPDTICGPEQIFQASVSIDSGLGLTVVDPLATVFQSVLYDNIGLFKNSYWISNPAISLTVSQGALPVNPLRYPLNINS